MGTGRWGCYIVFMLVDHPKIVPTVYDVQKEDMVGDDVFGLDMDRQVYSATQNTKFTSKCMIHAIMVCGI